MDRRFQSGACHSKSLSGFGLGLRPPFYHEAMQGEVDVDWFEIISENFMLEGGKPLAVLEAVRQHYPLVMHGVSMNLGGKDPLDINYLSQLKSLITQVQPVHISDHLCWTRHGGHHLHDLLPLPYTEEALLNTVKRIEQVQDRLQQQILIENVSSYAEFTHSTMTEWEFISNIANQADCFILLDINNICVSARNHGYDPHNYLNAIPVERVRQMHLAGHSMSGPLFIDTHDHPVSDPVWSLYEKSIQRFGMVPTMIERDDAIPPLADLLSELNIARQMDEKNRITMSLL